MQLCFDKSNLNPKFACPADPLTVIFLNASDIEPINILQNVMAMFVLSVRM